jgi:hypothetical protein
MKPRPLPRWLILAASPDQQEEDVVLDTWDWELAVRCWRAAQHDYALDLTARWTITLYELKPVTTPPLVPARRTLAGLPYDDADVEAYYYRRRKLAPLPAELASPPLHRPQSRSARRARRKAAC